MNRLVLFGGTASTTLGVMWFSIVSFNAWNCAHSNVPTSCPKPDFALSYFIYPLIIVGLVIIAYALLASKRQVPRVDSERREELVRHSSHATARKIGGANPVFDTVALKAGDSASQTSTSTTER